MLTTHQVTTKWRDILTGTADSQAVINVSDWLSRATLDVIGEGEGGIITKSFHALTMWYFSRL